MSERKSVKTKNAKLGTDSYINSRLNYGILSGFHRLMTNQSEKRLKILKN